MLSIKGTMWFVVLAAVALPLQLRAQTVLPGSADVGRIKPEDRMPAFDHSDDGKMALPRAQIEMDIPPEAKSIEMTLRGVKIEGMTAYSEDEFADLYRDKIGEKVPLALAWELAAMITKRYQDDGYFLSRAFVPPQKIGENGIIKIQVIEGYIGNIDIDELYHDRDIVKGYAARISAVRPASLEVIESTLLRLNDLPGLSFRAVLSLMKGAEDGAVNMTLVSTPETGEGSITFDNAGSRFLGPNEMLLSYSMSFTPFTRTTLSGLTSMPGRELKYGNLEHSIALIPDVTMSMRGNVVDAHPGFTLENLEIDSKSYGYALALQYQVIRQRHENLLVKLNYENRNSESDILDAPLTRDRIRTVTLGLVYDRTDAWNGTSIITTDVTQGIDGLGSNRKGDPYLSRAEAHPDFTKLELSISRMQRVDEDWSVLGAVSGQVASAPLFSSEEFGYGGTVFGRGYDAYELSGDKGINGMVELRYNAWASPQPVGIVPYVFYDIGKIWNLDTGEQPISGASAGIGAKLFSSWNMTGNVALAVPLTKPAETPIYGANPGSPRFLINITQGF